MRASVPRLVLGLTSALLLFACSQSPAPQMTTPPGQEAGTLPDGVVALSLDPGANNLYFEPILAATNGWGPIELDHSNGEQYPGDGKTLTLNGKTYARGFGAHAYSELRFALKDARGNTCTRFTADVGVDDEVGSRGSVVFQVFLDGQKAYDSGVMTGASATRRADVPINGQRELRMVVTDAGDGTSSDHADWAAPLIYCQAGTPPTQSPAGTLDPSFRRITPGFTVADTVVQPDGKIVVFGTGTVEGTPMAPGYIVARYNRDGSVDTSFGNAGRFTSNVGAGNTAIRVTVQPDGKIVGLGKSSYPKPAPTGVLIRLLPNGEPDATFSEDGILQTDDLPAVSRTLAVQPDGRIVVAGSARDLPGYSFDPSGGPVASFTVVRLLPSGQLDPGFGRGGRVVTTFPGFPNAVAQQLILQPDGKIVAGGVAEQYDPGPYRNWVYVRFQPNGAPDPLFDGDGSVVGLNDRFPVLQMTDLELQADGKLLAAGKGSLDNCVFERRGGDGSSDSTFNGYVLNPPDFQASVPSIAVQADQKVVVGGCNRDKDRSGIYDKTVLRLSSAGLLDTSFGNAGFATVDDNRNVLLQPGGKIVVGFNTIVRLFP
ncbi:NPCBM/NEW2 domain-containing protein [Deinococcus apachensis]|uniref:NPCBM/NEW2 domain-containing protein n=1 Tax=Deinococcus apachensis TaxID=309886 RepID=UPI0003722736|nr:NPCBM/NEW2 domain-containing protein [Deinococcus apachensis]